MNKALSSYTTKEDELLCNYIGEARPSEAGRLGNAIYQTLVENVDKWPWAKNHTWTGWRERYRMHKEEFDQRIRKIQKEREVQPTAQDPLPRGQRNPFTDSENKLLVQYLAKYSPQSKGRNGNEIYKRLVANEDGKWNWSRAHSWHSWRHLYVSRQDYFDRKIAKYIESHKVPAPRDHSTGRPAKRQMIVNDLDTQEEELVHLVASTSALREKTMNDLDTQEEELVHLVASTSVLQEKNTRVKKGPIVTREPFASTLLVNKTRSTDISETVEMVDDGSDPNEGDNEANTPPGSEDYAGEIFEDAEEDKVENSTRSPSGSETDNEGKSQGFEPTLTIPNNCPSAISQHPVEVLVEKGPDNSVRVIEKGGTSQSSLGSPPSRPLSKSHISRNNFTFASGLQDDDPFLDSPPPVAKRELTSLTSRKHPPILKEGPYGTYLSRKRPRKADESSSDVVTPDAQPTWPPRRDTNVLQMLRDSKIEGEHREYHRAEQCRREQAKAAEEVIVTEVEHQKNEQYPTGTSKFPADEALEPTKPHTSHHLQDIIDARPSQLVPLERTSTDIFIPLPHLTSISVTKRHSIGDVTSLTNVAGPGSRSSTRTINLRQELVKRNLNQPTQRPSPRVSNASHMSIMSEEDSSLLQELAIQGFSQEFGFTEAVVQKLWSDLKSLRLLKSALTDMKESAERSMSAWVEGVSARSSKTTSHSPTSSLTKSKSELMVRYVSGAMEPASAAGSSSRHRRHSSLGIGGKSLEIRPVDPLEASTAMEGEYEPLIGTRAGKYTRLAKLGREDEALEREQRRVSSVAYSPRRSELQQKGFDEVQTLDGRGSEDVIVKDAVEIEIQDKREDEEENQSQGAEMLDVVNQLDVTNEAQSGIPLDILMGIDSPIERRTDHNRRKTYEFDEDGVERETGSRRHLPQDNGRDHGQFAENGQERIGIKSEHPKDTNDVGVLARKQCDAKRWEEVEHLFLAANHRIAEDLRKIEKDFDPLSMMQWIANRAAMI